MKKLSCKKIVWLVALLLVLAFSAHVVCCMVMDVRSKDYRDADYNLVWGDTGREVDKEVDKKEGILMRRICPVGKR